jgi:hypothetical protein
MKFAQLVVLLVLASVLGCNKTEKQYQQVKSPHTTKEVGDYSGSVRHLVVRNTRTGLVRFRGEVHGLLLEHTKKHGKVWESEDVKGNPFITEFEVDGAQVVYGYETIWLTMMDSNEAGVATIHVGRDDEYIISEKPIPEIE